MRRWPLILLLLLFFSLTISIQQDDDSQPQPSYDTCQCYCCKTSSSSCTTSPSTGFPALSGKYPIYGGDITMCSAGLCNVHFPDACPNILQEPGGIVRINLTCDACRHRQVATNTLVTLPTETSNSNKPKSDAVSLSKGVTWEETFMYVLEVMSMYVLWGL